MAAKMLSIEIGDRLVKVCQSVKKGKSYQITDSFMFQTPGQSVSDGQILDDKLLGQHLKQNLVAHGASEVKNTTFVLSSSKVASREVFLPPMKENLIKSVIETNASEYFPVDMSNYQVTFSLLEKVTSPEAGLRVLVTAAPKTMLGGYLRLAEQAGLAVEAIDYCGNSQYQVLRGMPGNDTVMYVDVSISNTIVTMMRSGILLLQRNFGFGGDEMISAVMRAGEMEDNEYLEALKKCENEDTVNLILGEGQGENSLTRLLNGIVRSADFFKSNNADATVDKVVLMGTCCKLAGLQKMVREQMNKETILLHDVSGVEFVANSADAVSTYISCIGALVEPLALVPTEMMQKRRAAAARAKKDPNSIKTGVIVCAVCAGLAVILSAGSVIGYLRAEHQKQTMQARMEKLADSEKTYQTYVSYRQMQQDLTMVGDYAKTPNAQLTAFFDELEIKMPSSILILSATCDAQGVSMNITVPGLEEAANVISQLRSFESIQSILVGTITETPNDAGVRTASFSLSAAYVGQTTEANAQTGAAENKTGTAAENKNQTGTTAAKTETGTTGQTTETPAKTAK